jgi:RNA polymerase sigma-70 factor (ECF subfamily)
MEPADRPRSSSLKELEDRELVIRLVDRDREALAELYDRHASMLLALAKRVLGSREEAEEVVQEALLQVWNQADRYRSERSSVSTWMVLITRSRAIDRLRNRKVVERTVAAIEREESSAHASPEGVGAVLRHERGARLHEELARLPDEQRDVLDRAFFQGMTQREIAERTGIPLGTVKTRTLLAMKKLRAALRDELEALL